ncbi:imelysin family protein [Bordetella avium]|uniref:imelysin family protein n=1 Tax=Bordetella avium TaxID=521 RepID=UPI000E0CA8B2|nr:imelysin family protein [Bordetella avium]AZY49929.1 aminopeptidase [Bordetella avium]AZY53296.1 aminopeptidase [Bordetella avium]RIQ13112.1 aminopeptidase [Bordetella avium]RIQ17285.1 aminopeptidase [Bordetella avium]RIQ33770.1 aminopeptidase [Bordetella avium]
MKSLCVLATAALLAAPAWAAPPPDLGLRLADGYARPVTAALQARARTMQQDLSAWCQAADPAGAAKVDAAFGALAQAWAGVAFLRFGPLVQGNRFERLAFWPDTRGVMPKQIQSLLAAADPALLAEGALAGRSVAVQGLPALEYLLYGEPGLLRGSAASPYVCDYAVAVAGNIQALSSELAQAWSAQGGFGRQFTAPARDNDLYRNQQEVAAEAMKALSAGLQFVRDINLLPVLGPDAQAARPKRAAFWRSEQSSATLAASLRGLLAFYQAGGYTFAPGSQGLADTLNHELGQAAVLAAQAPADPAQAFTQAAPRASLLLTAMIVKNAKDLVDQDIAPALGVTIGFNALDGD